MQALIGAKNAVAFDLTAACSGFVLALVTAAQYVRTGACRTCLVVGGDALSRITDWRDRGELAAHTSVCGCMLVARRANACSPVHLLVLSFSHLASPLLVPRLPSSLPAQSNRQTPGTCILFGDGCGAVVVSAAPDGEPCALLGMDMHSDGSGQKALNAVFSDDGASSSGSGGGSESSSTSSGGGGGGPKPLREGPASSARASYCNIAMAGQDVFKFAVRSVPAVLEAALGKAGISAADVDWLVMHQANQRILDAAAQRLGVPPERVVSNLAEYGNTSAASIPLALDAAVRDGRVRDGDVLALAGFGAGLTWAGAIVRWGEQK